MISIPLVSEDGNIEPVRPREMHRSYGPRSSGAFHGPDPQLVRHERAALAAPSGVSAGTRPSGGSTTSDGLPACFCNQAATSARAHAGSPVVSVLIRSSTPASMSSRNTVASMRVSGLWNVASAAFRLGQIP